ncbi:MAG: carbohydrate binding family 9 domain-containing protein [Candidatus Latescibacterota bacterium]
MHGINRIPIYILEVFLMASLGIFALSRQAAASGVSLTPVRLSTAPSIDGDLSDSAWETVSPLDPAFVTLEPRQGEPAPEKTMIWLGYDEKNLYFAFRCFDSKPDRIKASLAARDKILGDDWIGVSLDAQNTQQNNCQFFANARGIQGDLSGGNDPAPDWVWNSAGKLIPEGFQVEMAIPLSSLRFASGHEVDMGILFARYITRDGITATWPEIQPKQSLASAHTPVMYRNLENPGSLEVLPSFTYGSGSSRISPNRWGDTLASREAGVSFKYSRSSALTLEATANPDFSHVESDAFQMDINRRYPVFYSEKRPFFMEGMDLFELSRGGSNLPATMHTRGIISPSASAKLTGTRGNLAYGLLLANDTGENSFRHDDDPIGKSQVTVARMKYLAGGENFLGALYSGRSHADGDNQAAALDGLWRFNGHTLRFTGIGTLDGDAETGKTRDGAAGTFSYGYSSRPLNTSVSLESFSPHFRMDTAFINRTGFHKAQAGVYPHFYPSVERLPWLKQVNLSLNSSLLHDLTTGLDDRTVSLGAGADFARQGYLWMDGGIGQEGWAGRVFHRRGFGIDGGLQATPRVRVGGWFSHGQNIFYDEDDPGIGRDTSYGGHLNYQPLDRLNQTLSISHSEFFRQSNGHREYSVNIVNSRTTFQFNRYFFIRAIVQYNSGNHRLLQDLLASFTLIPGTVMHLGYGGISQRNAWTGEEWEQKGVAPLYPMERRLFFKTSYLHRF